MNNNEEPNINETLEENSPDNNNNTRNQSNGNETSRQNSSTATKNKKKSTPTKQISKFLIRLVVIGLICVVGWYVYNNYIKTPSVDDVGAKISANPDEYDVWNGEVATSFAKGSGTARDPYQISTGAELAYFASLINEGNSEYCSACYCLVNSIDLNGLEWEQIGYSSYGSKTGIKYNFSNVHCFSGVFEGKNCVIKNFKITTSKKQMVGFFGDLSGATVRNLGLEDYVFSNTNDTTQVYYVGGIAGYSRNGSKIIGCYTSCDITFTSTTDDVYVGGIVGCNSKDSYIENCYSIGNVNAIYRAKSHYGYSNNSDANAGGIAAINSGTITNCYSKGNIYSYTNDGYVIRSGGIVAMNSSYGSSDTGFVHGTVTNCYALGNVSAAGSAHVYVGGLIGAHLSQGKVENCFATGNVSASVAENFSTNIGGLMGVSETSDVVNCYTLDSQSLTLDNEDTYKCNLGEKVDIATLRTSTFQSTILGLGDSWTISDGSYPNLINLPKTITISYGNAKKSLHCGDDFDLGVLNKDGYIFKGWSFNDTFITDAEGKKLATYDVNNDITAIATYDLISYSITYDNTKSVQFDAPNNFTVESQSIILPELSKNGYVFNGWFNGDNKVTQIPTGTFGDIVLRADWTIVGYEITYNNVDNAIHENPEAYDVEDEPLILLNATKTGYKFLGWYTDSNYETSITEIEIGTTGNLNLYAKWELIEYTATFVDGDNLVEEVKFSVESALTEPEVPVHNGYIGAWEEYVLGAADITIKATYTPIEYTITYEDTKDAKNQNPSTYTVEDGTIVLQALSKDGYSFDGWFYNNEKVTELATDTLSNVTLIAKWTCVYTQISTAQQLKSIAADGDYILMNDIDLSGSTWTPIASFTGNFIGDGHIISNFVIRSSGTKIGFFGSNEGCIKDLKLSNVTIEPSISCTSSTGTVYIGGLVAQNSGEIQNCEIDGTINATISCKADAPFGQIVVAGGLIGGNGSTIEFCESNISVKLTTTIRHYDGPAVDYLHYFEAGGLIGSNSGDVIGSCATSTVEVNTSASLTYTHTRVSSWGGGLIGVNSGRIINCYAQGDVSVANSSNVSSSRAESAAFGGGLIAHNQQGLVSNSYASGNVIVNSVGKSTSYTDAYAYAYGCSHSYAGGLIGSNYYTEPHAGGGTSTGQTINCFATGDVTSNCTASSIKSTASTYAYADGLIGDTPILTNSYCCDEQTITATENQEAVAIRTCAPSISKASLLDKNWIGNNIWKAEIDAWIFDGSHPTLNFEQMQNSSTIKIETADDLKALQGGVLLFDYELTNDIDLGGTEWIPISMLLGSFDGKGYTISNIKITEPHINTGFVGYNLGTIKQLNINAISINISGNTNLNVGGVAGYNTGSIEGCVVSGAISSVSTGYEKNNYVGGIVGANLGVVSDSSSSATVVAESSSRSTPTYAGGIAGYSTNLIENCSSSGNITTETANTSSNSCAGGIVGYNNYNDFSEYYAIILNCYSTGTIKSTSSASIAYAGGIAGYNHYKGNSKISIVNSYSTGDVKADSTEKSAYAGGIAGINNGYYLNAQSINNSYSTGNIEAKSQSSISYAGGIYGAAYSGGKISNCYSTGTVTATSSESDAMVGGIVGLINSTGTIENTYSFGNISSTSNSANAYAGAIVGNASDATITNSYYHEGQTIELSGAGSTEDTRGTKVATDSLLKATFIKETLGWSADVWNIVDNQHPTLK